MKTSNKRWQTADLELIYHGHRSGTHTNHLATNREKTKISTKTEKKNRHKKYKSRKAEINSKKRRNFDRTITETQTHQIKTLQQRKQRKWKSWKNNKWKIQKYKKLQSLKIENIESKLWEKCSLFAAFPLLAFLSLFPPVLFLFCLFCCWPLLVFSSESLLVPSPSCVLLLLSPSPTPATISMWIKSISHSVHDHTQNDVSIRVWWGDSEREGGRGEKEWRLLCVRSLTFSFCSAMDR